ncbi:MAG: hypothetical protein WKF59_09930 [Chitinophagaceae bacterium]
MGDPETEVVLLRLKNDLVELFLSTSKQKLGKQKIDIDQRCAATIVAVSGGYPAEYEKGKSIDLGYLDNPESIKTIGPEGGIMVFHSGTKKSRRRDCYQWGKGISSISAYQIHLQKPLSFQKISWIRYILMVCIIVMILDMNLQIEFKRD